MNRNIECIAENIIEQFEEATSADEAVLSQEQAEDMIRTIGDLENFKACMPLFRDKALAYKQAIDLREQLTKQSQLEKKIWKARLDSFLNGFLGRALSHYGEKSLKGDDNSRVTSSTRDNVVVDDERLITIWEPVITALQSSLPSFLKVTVSVDKKALTEYCRTKEDLFATHSDIVFTVPKTSTTIK